MKTKKKKTSKPKPLTKGEVIVFPCGSCMTVSFIGNYIPMVGFTLPNHREILIYREAIPALREVLDRFEATP